MYILGLQLTIHGCNWPRIQRSWPLTTTTLTCEIFTNLIFKFWDTLDCCSLMLESWRKMRCVCINPPKANVPGYACQYLPLCVNSSVGDRKYDHGQCLCTRNNSYREPARWRFESVTLASCTYTELSDQCYKQTLNGRTLFTTLQQRSVSAPSSTRITAAGRREIIGAVYSVTADTEFSLDWSKKRSFTCIWHPRRGSPVRISPIFCRPTRIRIAMQCWLLDDELSRFNTQYHRWRAEWRTELVCAQSQSITMQMTDADTCVRLYVRI